jgi:stage II sporulation protein E
MSRRVYAVNNISGLLAGRLETQAGKVFLKAFTSFLAGLFASRAMIFGGMSPFGIAAVAASSRSDSIFTLLGAGVGYLLPYGPEFQVRYLAAATTVFLFKWILSGDENILKQPAFAPSVAAGGCLLTGLVAVISSGLLLTDIVNLAAETLICACSVMFFEKAIPLLKQPSNLWGLDRHELVCVIITYCVMLLALTPLSFSGISLGRILGVLTILVAARYGSEAGGCMTGAATGLILGLGDKNMMFILGGYAFGGLMAGIFSPTGRFGCTAAFILANAVAGISAGSTPQMVAGLYEVMAATILFMLLPEKFLCRFSAMFQPIREMSGIKSDKSGVSARLTEAAAALSEVAETVSQVGDKLQNISVSQDISSVYSNAADITCKRCGMRMYCWGTAYNDTMAAFADMTDIIKKNGELSREDAPRHFAGRCCRLGDLLSSINRCYGEFNARGCAQRKTEFLRGLLIEEFTVLAGFLNDLGGKMNGQAQVRQNDEEIRAAFAACGLSVADSFCSRDEKGHIEIEAVIEKKGKTAIRKNELLKELSFASGRKLDGPFVSNDKKNLTLNFTQKPALSCTFAMASINKDGEKLCGDAAESFIDEKGKAVLILSDGMGCGGSAAVDSNLTLKLMSRLLRSDFSYESALRLVNAAMMLKSGEESFATLDIAAVDLFTGEAEFLKAGSPPTYIRRCGRMERITQTSMPVGILRNIKLERSNARMRQGDMIVIVSDGALSGDDAWLIKAIENYDDEAPDAFAQWIAKKAKDQRNDGHDDDITVLLAKIE